MTAVTVNGHPTDLPPGADVGTAVRALLAAPGPTTAAGAAPPGPVAVGAAPERAAPDGRGIAVAVNGEVVPRTAWAGTPLRDGDRVEVLSATQGG
jgi:sulfur carrier protein